MKTTLFSILCLLYSITSFAQTATVNWGEEFKIKKGSIGLSIVNVAKDVIFLREIHSISNSVGDLRNSTTLIKLNESQKEIYRINFDSELKGKELIDFFFINNKCHLLAYAYEANEDKQTLFTLEIDKEKGVVSGGWKPIYSYPKNSKKDKIYIGAKYNMDSTGIIVLVTQLFEENIKYSIAQLNHKFSAITKETPTVTFEYNSYFFKFEDILVTPTSNIIIAGQVFGYPDNGKKKSIELKKHMVRIFDQQGKLIKEINSKIDNKWLINSKMLYTNPDEIVIGSFYSDNNKKETVDAMEVKRVNTKNGDILSTSFKELSHAALSGNLSKEANNGSLKGEYFFRSMIPTIDRGFILSAEEFEYKFYETVSRKGLTTIKSGNIILNKFDQAGNLQWIKAFPKLQIEREDDIGRPYYSGFLSFPLNNNSKIGIILNDGAGNADVTEFDQKFNDTENFTNSNCYFITVDIKNGAIKRAIIFKNDDNPVSMPRFGVSNDNNIYLMGRKNHGYGKSNIIAGKITVK